MLDLDRREHLELKVLYASSLHQHCLWNALELWNLCGLVFLFLFLSPQEFSVTHPDGGMMV